MNNTVIDSRAIWNLRPEWIPGEVVKGPSDAVHRIKISIRLLYPDSRPLDMIYLTSDSAGDKVSPKDKILFTTKLAEVAQRSTPFGLEEVQPDKVVVDKVRKVTNQEHTEAVNHYAATRANKINEIAQQLQAKYEDDVKRIEQEVEKRAEEKIAPERESIARAWQENTANLNKYNEEQQQLQSARQELERDKVDFAQAGGLELLELIRQSRASDTKDEDIPEKLEDEHNQIPHTVVKEINSHFQRQNYSVDDPLLLQTLLCLCVGAATGQFIVLTGPPGSGKTSLVGKMARAVGAGSGVVPVRPAWIDTTDLVGFYNPGMNRYQPTPFLDYVLRAKSYTDRNRLYCLVLDEMNLGRVENYAADFLSLLEKSREGDRDAKLMLYSGETGNRFLDEIERYPARRTKLQHHMLTFPHKLTLPEGLVLFGTINVDETTHLPSPKFLDRSLTIQVSGTKLPEDLVNLDGATSESGLSWELSLTTAKRCLEAGKELSHQAQETWKLLMNWNEKYFKPLGMRLSHRLPQVYRCYMGAASVLNIPDAQHQQVADTFILSKIMPLISFRDGDFCENGGKQDNDKPTKRAKLEEWRNYKDESETELKDRFPLVHAALETMTIPNRPGLIVRYLE